MIIQPKFGSHLSHSDFHSSNLLKLKKKPKKFKTSFSKLILRGSMSFFWESTTLKPKFKRDPFKPEGQTSFLGLPHKFFFGFSSSFSTFSLFGKKSKILELAMFPGLVIAWMICLVFEIFPIGSKILYIVSKN